MIPMSVIFFISALAETNRPPFDLPEAESELVAGYQVEYSSTPYLLFMIGEYANIVLMCALITVLFFGGWQPPFPDALPGRTPGRLASLFGFLAGSSARSSSSSSCSPWSRPSCPATATTS